MVTQYYEIEIAYRREQLMQARQRVGLSRRELRRRRAEQQVALEASAPAARRVAAAQEPARPLAAG